MANVRSLLEQLSRKRLLRLRQAFELELPPTADNPALIDALADREHRAPAARASLRSCRRSMAPGASHFELGEDRRCAGTSHFKLAED